MILILLGRDVEKIEQLYAYHEKKAVFDIDIRDEAALTAFSMNWIVSLGRLIF